MSYGFERLKEIGMTKIHKETHISLSNLKMILNADFEKIPKVQLSGFISILEREYNLDLSNLRADVLDHREEKNIVEDEENIFTPEETPTKFPKIYIAALIVLLVAIAGVLSFSDDSSQIPSNTVYDKNNSSIQIVQENLNKIKKDKILSEAIDDTLEAEDTTPTATQEENIMIPQTIEDETEDVVATVTNFTIIPKSRVWVGFIDVASQKKSQKIISKPLEMDGTKEWLFLFGHGNVKVELGDELLSYKGKKSLRFHYKDGKITKLTLEEFKNLNNGSKW